MKNSFNILFTFLCFAASSYTGCAGVGGHGPLWRHLLKKKESPKQDYNLRTESLDESKDDSLVYLGSQKGLKVADKIEKLPGQPSHVKFSQYSGYVTVDPNAGRALFYYFAEAENPNDKPLVLWQNGGPGCSSFGFGAMTELGPFRVNPDGKTLSYNQYAWNKVANVLFLEFPAGVGFSYSNRSSDYVTGDKQTAADSYTFLVNWLDRFPEYKSRDFFLAGESYAGHFIPQLADLILTKNFKTTKTNYTVIKLKGFAIGNAYIDYEDTISGIIDYYWSHALISDETHSKILKYCNSSSPDESKSHCNDRYDTFYEEMGNINLYEIYAPLCLKRSTTATPSGVSSTSFDPCIDNYVTTYLNTVDVQKALHVDIFRQWINCSYNIGENWKDMPKTVIPVIKKLVTQSGLRFLIYSGDTDGVVPVTITKLSLPKLGANIETPWYPWYHLGEVGGYAVGYNRKLTFATVRGSGHMVPSYQPQRALALFASFLEGKSPPRGK